MEEIILVIAGITKGVELVSSLTKVLRDMLGSIQKVIDARDLPEATTQELLDMIKEAQDKLPKPE